MENKFFGVVEGFYRRPYTFKQRTDLIKFLSQIDLNTYVYGPKSDVFHRKKWFAPYPADKLKEFKLLNDLSKECSIVFNYALSPLAKPEIKEIIEKVNSMLAIGIENYSLFYDDIRIPLNKEMAMRQAETANILFEFLSNNLAKPILFFCPTQYRGFEKTEYLLTIAQKLKKNIQILWTGKNVVSRKITEKEIDNITEIINRPPIIWDNLFANDYIPGVILKYPYRNREAAIVDKVRGILINPMNQYEKSKPLIYTAAKFINDPNHYDGPKAWREARYFISLKP